MDVFLEIALYSSLVFIGLSIVGGAFVLLGKFLTDIVEDPDAHH